MRDIPVEAGNYPHRITFYGDQGTEPDSHGHADEVPGAIGKAWAKIEPRSGREFWHGDQVEADVTHLVECHYRDDVTNNDWFLFDGRRFNLASVRNDMEANIRLLIQAVEVV